MMTGGCRAVQTMESFKLVRVFFVHAAVGIWVISAGPGAFLETPESSEKGDLALHDPEKTSGNHNMDLRTALRMFRALQ